MQHREPKEDDQEMAEKASQLMMKLIESHPEIEPNIWMAGVWGATVSTYIDSGATWEEFKKENDARMRHYKHWWD